MESDSNSGDSLVLDLNCRLAEKKRERGSYNSSVAVDAKGMQTSKKVYFLHPRNALHIRLDELLMMNIIVLPGMMSLQLQKKESLRNHLSKKRAQKFADGMG